MVGSTGATAAAVGSGAVPEVRRFLDEMYQTL